MRSNSILCAEWKRHDRDRGIAVLLFSAELDEIMALSDRIAVMYRGQIVSTVEAKKVTREQLGLWMAGAQPEK